MTEIRPIAGACVWHGSDMARSMRWRRHLSPLQLAEIDAALKAARARHIAWQDMEAADFRLPSCAALADDIREELEDGSGIVLLQGIEPGRYTPEEQKLLYAGFCRLIGTPVYSNRAGEVMREIRDVTRDAAPGGRDVGERYGALPDASTTGAFLSSYARTLTNQQLRFHTDRCDVVALFCIRQAARGGVSKLCSSPAVHNAMLARHPELCAVLYEDLWRSRFGEEYATDEASYPLPVWGVRDGKFTSHYSRTFVEAAQRRPASEVPRLKPAQTKALDLLHDLAEELCFEMTFAPGDIQFVNNHVIYHARTEFEDEPDQGADRLLLRLWLAVPNSRPLPLRHEILWRSTEPGALRGGIGQSGVAGGLARPAADFGICEAELATFAEGHDLLEALTEIELESLPLRPTEMRHANDIGHLQQWVVAIGDWFIFIDIDGGRSRTPRLEGRDQRARLYQLGPRDIDQQCGRLHDGQVGGGDNAVGFGSQSDEQLQHVGPREQFGLGCRRGITGGPRLGERGVASPNQHIHAEALAGFGDQAADRAETENAQGAAAQPMRQRARPLAAPHPFCLRDDVTPSRQHQRDRQLGRRFRRAAFAIGDADAVFGAGGMINLARVSSDERQEPQLRQPFDQAARKRDPLPDRDDNLGLGKSVGKLRLIARRGAVAGDILTL